MLYAAAATAAVAANAETGRSPDTAARNVSLVERHDVYDELDTMDDVDSIGRMIGNDESLEHFTS